MFKNFFQSKPPLERLSAVVSIVSAAYIVIKLAWYGTLSPEMSATLLIGVVVLVAIGKHVGKLGASCVGIYIFAKYASGGDEEEFIFILSAIITIIIILVITFFILRSLFRIK